jgi:hypothetical protein
LSAYVFNAPPGWDVPAGDWVPPKGWTPEPNWPPAPPQWSFWIPAPASSPPPPPPPASPASVLGSAPAAPPPRAPAPASQPPSDTGDAGTERERLEARVAELEAELHRLRSAPAPAATADIELDDHRVLQEVGIYQYHHPLENAAEYRDQLAALGEEIKVMVRDGDAVLASDLFTFNNSIAQGRKMTREFSKLMLRAYNAEADNCVRTLRAGNVLTAKKRLDTSVTAIAKLGAMMDMRINPEYHQLRYRELELTADYLMKAQVEKEAAREERERLREERKAEQELAAERERLAKERAHYANALEAVSASGDATSIAEISARLDEIDEAIARNDFRAANIRAGYVYVISNTGSLGPNIVKIGLTRRLEPMDRVRELGDASVPFPFDVHALFFSEDAVTVEADLHRAFASLRVNRVNERREFFFATPAEVREILTEQVGNLLEFTDEPEATQYFQSKKYWPAAASA